MSYDFLAILDLYDELRNYERVWFHKTSNFGYELVHVLDEEGRELARLINSTGKWEWRKRSPERWYPIPADATEYEFYGDVDHDSFHLSMLASVL